MTAGAGRRVGPGNGRRGRKRPGGPRPSALPRRVRSARRARPTRRAWRERLGAAPFAAPPPTTTSGRSFAISAGPIPRTASSSSRDVKPPCASRAARIAAALAAPIPGSVSSSSAVARLRSRGARAGAGSAATRRPPTAGAREGRMRTRSAASKSASAKPNRTGWSWSESPRDPGRSESLEAGPGEVGPTGAPGQAHPAIECPAVSDRARPKILPPPRAPGAQANRGRARWLRAPGHVVTGTPRGIGDAAIALDQLHHRRDLELGGLEGREPAVLVRQASRVLQDARHVLALGDPAALQRQDERQRDLALAQVGEGLLAELGRPSRRSRDSRRAAGRRARAGDRTRRSDCARRGSRRRAASRSRSSWRAASRSCARSRRSNAPRSRRRRSCARAGAARLRPSRGSCAA